MISPLFSLTSAFHLSEKKKVAVFTTGSEHRRCQVIFCETTTLFPNGDRLSGFTMKSCQNRTALQCLGAQQARSTTII